MTEQPPELWSDFDGTAVKKYSIKNPARWLQNSLKYPLPGLHGYAEFLAGVEAGGVAIGGVVSKRPDIFPRRWVTALSISQLGLKEFFGRDGQVILAGRESAKGRFVASRTRESVVGVIDDQPQNFVPALVDGLLAEANNGAEFGVAVVGVVDHPRSRERIDRLGGTIRSLECRQPIRLRTLDNGSGLVVEMAHEFTVSVVALEPYSHGAGEVFAGQILGQAERS